jgi:hypothetical protein
MYGGREKDGLSSLFQVLSGGRMPPMDVKDEYSFTKLAPCGIVTVSRRNEPSLTVTLR